ncbi:glycosyltransferase [Pelagibacterales bacterium SAG-MED45]|nr:glycosyltransferase [Pelagibacterales bacterium SAG-MED45]
MKSVYYWSPYLTNVATIKAVINSATSLKKFSKKFDPVIINSCGEFNKFKEELDNKEIKVLNLLSFNIHKFLPSKGFFSSRLSFIVIFLTTFFPLMNFIKSKKPDYLILHLITSLPIIISNLIKSETKYILRISGLPKYNLLRKFIWKKLGKKIYKITCPTNGTLNDLSLNNLFDNQKLVLLKDPVLNIKEINKKKNEMLNGNINSADYNIISVGRLTKQKNFKLIINCFDQFLKFKENSKLTIIGEGEDKLFLQNLINKKKLSHKIRLVGFKKNIFKYFKNSDLFILSSLWEDPGWVLIEAAMSDILILSSDCRNGPGEFIQDNEGGILFKNNSSRDLIDKFKDVINLNKGQIFIKKVFSKKKAGEFTLFNHYSNLEKILN